MLVLLSFLYLLGKLTNDVFWGTQGHIPSIIQYLYVPFLEMTLTTKTPTKPCSGLRCLRYIYVYGNLEGSHIKSPKNTDFVLANLFGRQLWRISTHESVREMYAGKAGMGIQWIVLGIFLELLLD